MIYTSLTYAASHKNVVLTRYYVTGMMPLLSDRSLQIMVMLALVVSMLVWHNNIISRLLLLVLRVPTPPKGFRLYLSSRVLFMSGRKLELSSILCLSSNSCVSSILVPKD